MNPQILNKFSPEGRKQIIKMEKRINEIDEELNLLEVLE